MKNRGKSNNSGDFRHRTACTYPVLRGTTAGIQKTASQKCGAAAMSLVGRFFRTIAFPV